MFQPCIIDGQLPFARVGNHCFSLVSLMVGCPFKGGKPLFQPCDTDGRLPFPRVGNHCFSLVSLMVGCPLQGWEPRPSKRHVFYVIWPKHVMTRFWGENLGISRVAFSGPVGMGRRARPRAGAGARGELRAQIGKATAQRPKLAQKCCGPALNRTALLAFALGLPPGLCLDPCASKP